MSKNAAEYTGDPERRRMVILKGFHSVLKTQGPQALLLQGKCFSNALKSLFHSSGSSRGTELEVTQYLCDLHPSQGLKTKPSNVIREQGPTEICRGEINFYSGCTVIAGLFRKILQPRKVYQGMH